MQLKGTKLTLTSLDTLQYRQILKKSLLSSSKWHKAMSVSRRHACSGQQSAELSSWKLTLHYEAIFHVVSKVTWGFIGIKLFLYKFNFLYFYYLYTYYIDRIFNFIEN